MIGSFKPNIENNNDSDANSKKTHPRVKFTQSEDELLKKLVESLGANDWQSISRQIPGRNARQCRDRWQNYLSPEVVNGPWTQDEEELLVKKYEELGPSWKQIATFFPTRTDINIKSRWHLRERRLKKEELQMKKALLRQQPINKRMCAIQPVVSVSQLPNQMLPSTPFTPNIIQTQSIDRIQQIHFIPQYHRLPQIPQQIINPIIQHPPALKQIAKPQKVINTIKTKPSSNQAPSDESLPSINSSPLPFFSTQDPADNENEISFLANDNFDSSSSDCWNSLLMNEDNGAYENVFDSWF